MPADTNGKTMPCGAVCGLFVEQGKASPPFSGGDYVKTQEEDV
jgi:hypothetical protein